MSAKLDFRPQEDHSPKTQPHAVGHEIRVAYVTVSSSASVAGTDLLSKEKNRDLCLRKWPVIAFMKRSLRIKPEQFAEAVEMAPSVVPISNRTCYHFMQC